MKENKKAEHDLLERECFEFDHFYFGPESIPDHQQHNEDDSEGPQGHSGWKGPQEVSGPTSSSLQAHLRAQGFIHSGLENLQGQSLHDFSRPPDPMPDFSLGKGFTLKGPLWKLLQFIILSFTGGVCSQTWYTLDAA